VEPHHGFGHIVLSRVSQFTGLSCPSQTIPFGMPTVFVGWIISDPRFHSGVHVQIERNAKGRDHVER